MNAQCEVGQAKIQYRNSYLNVLEYEVWVHYYPPATTKNGECKNQPPVLIMLPVGLCESVEDFIMEINKMLMVKGAFMEI